MKWLKNVQLLYERNLMEIYKFVCSSKNLYHATQKRCKTEKNLLYIIMRLNTHGPPPLVPGSILTPSDQCRDHPI